MNDAIPQLEAIQRLADTCDDRRVTVYEAAHVDCAGRRLPLHVFVFGRAASGGGALGIFGGVHGLERIGTDVATAFVHSLLERLRWDASLEALLERVRIVVMPLVNPGGLWQRTRANPRGVDLMRNAPVDAEEPVPWGLGGQRWSPALPWYRGAEGEPMQVESAAMCATVERELGPHPFALAIDCHSGFGLRDRLWFPYAGTDRPIEHLAEMQALAGLLDESLVHHRYLVEPQSRTYRAHGDLWDHLYRRALQRPSTVLLPLTLEMGSWVWVRKNPRQIFHRHGLFNPLIEHRRHRVLRRHLALLDFALRAAASHLRWRPAPAERAAGHQRGLDRWYGVP